MLKQARVDLSVKLLIEGLFVVVLLQLIERGQSEGIVVFLFPFDYFS